MLRASGKPARPGRSLGGTASVLRAGAPAIVGEVAGEGARLFLDAEERTLLAGPAVPVELHRDVEAGVVMEAVEVPVAGDRGLRANEGGERSWIGLGVHLRLPDGGSGRLT